MGRRADSFKNLASGSDMILPKEFFEKIEYWEHSTDSRNGELYDKFTIHLKGWWRRKREIWIRRQLVETDENGTTFWNSTPGAADLHNQLNDWATQTYEEKLDSIKKKYEPPKDGSNVITLKPKPQDLDD